MTNTSEINVHISEQPGKIGRHVAAELGRKIEKLLENPAFFDEVEERLRRKNSENQKEDKP